MDKEMAHGNGIRYDPHALTIIIDGSEPLDSAWDFMVNLVSTSALIASRKGGPNVTPRMRKRLFVISEEAFLIRNRRTTTMIDKAFGLPITEVFLTMLDTHTTQEGQKMLIAEMDTQHIVNFCKLVLNAALEAKIGAARQQNMSDFHRALYEVPKRDAVSVGREVRQALNRLHPYLAELFFRGDNSKAVKEVRGLLEELTDREGQMQMSGAFELLPLNKES